MKLIFVKRLTVGLNVGFLLVAFWSCYNVATLAINMALPPDLLIINYTIDNAIINILGWSFILWYVTHLEVNQEKIACILLSTSNIILNISKLLLHLDKAAIISSINLIISAILFFFAIYYLTINVHKNFKRKSVGYDDLLIEINKKTKFSIKNIEDKSKTFKLIIQYILKPIGFVLFLVYGVLIIFGFTSLLIFLPFAGNKLNLGEIASIIMALYCFFVGLLVFIVTIKCNIKMITKKFLKTISFLLSLIMICLGFYYNNVSVKNIGYFLTHEVFFLNGIAFLIEGFLVTFIDPIYDFLRKYIHTMPPPPSPN